MFLHSFLPSVQEVIDQMNSTDPLTTIHLHTSIHPLFSSPFFNSFHINYHHPSQYSLHITSLFSLSPSPVHPAFRYLTISSHTLPLFASISSIQVPIFLKSLPIVVGGGGSSEGEGEGEEAVVWGVVDLSLTAAEEVEEEEEKEGASPILKEDKN
jgi:hypothetical protein